MAEGGLCSLNGTLLEEGSREQRDVEVSGVWKHRAQEVPSQICEGVGTSWEGCEGGIQVHWLY